MLQKWIRFEPLLKESAAQEAALRDLADAFRQAADASAKQAPPASSSSASLRWRPRGVAKRLPSEDARHEVARAMVARRHVEDQAELEALAARWMTMLRADRPKTKDELAREYRAKFRAFERSLVACGLLTPTESPRQKAAAACAGGTGT